MKTPCLLLWSKDNNIRCIPNARFLHTCFDNELSKYSKAVIIDSDHNVFLIKDVTKIGWGTFFGGIHLLYRHRLIKIRYNIMEKYASSLKEIKNILLKKIEAKPTGRFMVEYFDSIDNLKTLINSSENLSDLIDLFNQDQ